MVWEGKFPFEIAKIHRNAYKISSILSSSEIWYGTTQNELEGLEQVDGMWMRNFMNCSYMVPKDLLYLELAITPIRYIIQTRILLYLHHILQQKKESLLYRFFVTQLSNPTPRDLRSKRKPEVEVWKHKLSVMQKLYGENPRTYIVWSLTNRKEQKSYIHPKLQWPIWWQFRRTILCIKITQGEYVNKGLK